jgi:putative polyketide hydroxylase
VRGVGARDRGGMFTTDVLVVGAGPAGLATAVSALRHGARVLVVERRAGPSTVPRATGISIHTMEVLRGWGVADAVRAGSIDCDPTVTVAESLADPPREVVPLAWPSLREIVAASPALPAVVPQDHLEPVLVDEVRRRGGTVRFGAPLTALRTTADGVRAVVGGVRVRARFVVGADGPHSTVRTALGIGSERVGVIGEFTLTLFRAEGMPPRPSALNFVAEGVLLPLGSRRWGFVRQGAAWLDALRQAIGRPLELDVLGTSTFTMAADVASTYRAGPGFLVGDAAHRMTPYAGAGLNTAIHDGHELGWRLAWVARGIAGDALLSSYAVEREPVGRMNALRSLSTERHPDDGLPRDLGGTYRSAVIVDDGAAPATGHHRTARPGERAPHVWFRRGGQRRSTLDLFDGRMTVLAGPDGRWGGEPPCSSPLRGVPGGGPDHEPTAAGKRPVHERAAPGGRPGPGHEPGGRPDHELAAPGGRPHPGHEPGGRPDHELAAPGGRPHPGHEPGGRPDHEQAVPGGRPHPGHEPGSLSVDGVPVAVLRVGRDLPDPRGVIRRAYRLGAETAVLVRPDGVVAWRHDGPADPAALAAAVRTAVGRQVPAAVAV